MRNVLLSESNAKYYKGIDKVYLASADQFKGMEKIIEQKNFPKCENFFTVIGGMGGIKRPFQIEEFKKCYFL